MYGRKVYLAEETKNDTHDARGTIFFRQENDNKVAWEIARFGSQSDEFAVKKIYQEGFFRVNLVGVGKEYHRIKMCTLSDAMYSLIGSHMGIDKAVVEKIIKKI